MRGRKLFLNCLIARLLTGIFIFLVVLAVLLIGFFAFAKNIQAEDLPVAITEISPINGTNYSEFLEFYNSGTEAVDIYGWKINYAWGTGSRNHTISTHLLIEPETYLSYSISENGVLRDSNGFVQLINSLGNIVGSKIEYGTMPDNTIIKDQSLSLIEGKWQITATQTPGADNILTLPVAPEDSGGGDVELKPISISSAKKLELDQQVEVVGVVTAVPGEISDRYFYIQDESSGIQIYSYYKTFPSLKRGDHVLVSGVLSQYYNESRIKISDLEDIHVFESTGEIVPQEISFSQISDFEGCYITLRGNVSNPSGDQFFVVDSAGNEIKVIVKNNDIVQKPRLFSGNKATISGIASKYKDSYRILPFSAQDVKILSQELPKAGLALEFVYLALYIILSIWFTNLIQKKRQKSLPTISLNLSMAVRFLPCAVILVAARLLLPRALPAVWRSKRLLLAPPLLL